MCDKRHDLHLAGTQRSIIKSLEPRRVEEDVGSLSAAEAANFAGREWRRRKEPHSWENVQAFWDEKGFRQVIWLAASKTLQQKHVSSSFQRPVPNSPLFPSPGSFFLWLLLAAQSCGEGALHTSSRGSQPAQPPAHTGLVFKSPCSSSLATHCSHLVSLKSAWA